MASLIKSESIELVRQRANIDDVVSEHVQLRNAGMGTRKGLCPFHDEKTPSFTVRPELGFYHCFGCGAGGDVIKFVQEIDHVSFVDAVEFLATKFNVALQYEEGTGGPNRPVETSKRRRVLDANLAAEEFFRQQLLTPDAGVGRQFLQGKGFDRHAAEHFGLGFAPDSFNALRQYMHGLRFSDEELILAGLLSENNGRVYDRFRGRVIWPIRDITGAPIGFGARKLLETDKGPKYLNTPETPVYRKSQVLYGLDLAKKEIAADKQVVVVEGYTDVMACHLAGIETAVATCGTAFGSDHAKVIRRMLTVGDMLTGELIFTFDGDAAGQKAALKTFELEGQFPTQSFVAVSPDGLDPCDVRLQRGGEALHAVLDTKVPLHEFVIQTRMNNWDLRTVEGRTQALRDVAPVLLKVRGKTAQDQYARKVAGWLGMGVDDVESALRYARKVADGKAEQKSPGRAPVQQLQPDDPVILAERQLLSLLVQWPGSVPAEGVARTDFTLPAHEVVFDAVCAAGGFAGAVPGSEWARAVFAHVPEQLHPAVRQLAATQLPLPENDQSAPGRFAYDLVVGIREKQLLRQKADLMSMLQRLDIPAEQRETLDLKLLEIEHARRTLRRD